MFSHWDLGIFYGSVSKPLITNEPRILKGCFQDYRSGFAELAGAAKLFSALSPQELKAAELGLLVSNGGEGRERGRRRWLAVRRADRLRRKRKHQGVGSSLSLKSGHIGKVRVRLKNEKMWSKSGKLHLWFSRWTICRWWLSSWIFSRHCSSYKVEMKVKMVQKFFREIVACLIYMHVETTWKD